MSREDFSAGLRYENYLNPLLGFDQRYKGNGIPYRFLTYKKDELEVTVGNYYEQFGSGIIFRTYESGDLAMIMPWKAFVLNTILTKEFT